MRFENDSRWQRSSGCSRSSSRHVQRRHEKLPLPRADIRSFRRRAHPVMSVLTSGHVVAPDRASKPLQGFVSTDLPSPGDAYNARRAQARGALQSKRKENMEDCSTEGSIYSHASVVDIEEIDDEEFESFEEHKDLKGNSRKHQVVAELKKREKNPRVQQSTSSRRKVVNKLQPARKHAIRRTFSRIYGRRTLRASPAPVVKEMLRKRQIDVIMKPLESQSSSVSVTDLCEICVHATAELCDMKVSRAKCMSSKLPFLLGLLRQEEHDVIEDLLQETTSYLCSEQAKSNWPRRKRWVADKPLPALAWYAARNTYLKNIGGKVKRGSNADGSSDDDAGLSVITESEGSLSPWQSQEPRKRSASREEMEIAMLRAVVFGIQSQKAKDKRQEALLIRMASEYQREIIKRRYRRCEILDVPLSFAFTLFALTSALLRLDCSFSVPWYGGKGSRKRRGIPHARLAVRVPLDDGLLKFGIEIHGSAPCTIVFRRPGLFSIANMEEFPGIVGECKEIVAAFAKDIASG